MPPPPRNRSSAPGINAVAMADFERRLRRVRIIFWVCAGLIPCGCLSPLVVTPLLPRGADRSIPLVFAVLTPFVPLIGAILMLGDRSRYRRSLAIAQLGQEMGMIYTEKPSKGQCGWLNHLQMFRHASGDVPAIELLEGETAGMEAFILDCGHSVGHGRYRKIYQQTLVALRGAVPDVPDFLLYPRSWLSWLPGLMGERQLKLPDEPEFNQRFILLGEPEDVTKCFTNRIIDWCLENEHMTVEASGGTLVISRIGKRAKPQVWADLFNEALELAAALRGGPATRGYPA